MGKKQPLQIDPSQTVIINGSAAQLLGSLTLTVLASLGVGAAVWLKADILSTTALIAFLLGTAGLVGLSFLIARMLFSSDAPVLMISPEGVRDLRLSKDTVPWSDVQDVRVRRNRHVKVIELVLNKEADKSLTFRPIPRLLRNVERLSKSVKFNISAHGLLISHNQLLATLEAYAQAHKSEDA